MATYYEPSIAAPSLGSWQPPSGYVPPTTPAPSTGPSTAPGPTATGGSDPGGWVDYQVWLYSNPGGTYAQYLAYKAARDAPAAGPPPTTSGPGQGGPSSTSMWHTNFWNLDPVKRAAVFAQGANADWSAEGLEELANRYRLGGVSSRPRQGW